MLYRIGCMVSWIFFRIFGGRRVIGRENIPRSGGVIIAPNHRSHVDPPLVASSMNRPVSFMAKEELFQVPVFGGIIHRAGAFPVTRGTADRRALKKAIDLLNAGSAVCIFPEGTRSLDGKLGRSELGIGFIALKSRAPVVPVAIIDTEKVLPSGVCIPRYHQTRIIFGEPITFPDLYGEKQSRDAIEESGARIMSAISELQKKHAAG